MDPIAEARQAWRDGRVVDACKQCDAVLARHPYHPDGLLLAAEISARHGEPAQARTLARRALNGLADQPDQMLRAAVVLYECGLDPVCRSAFTEARRRRPADPDLAFREAVYALTTGRPGDALAAADVLGRTHPAPDLDALRGLALRRLGHREAAILAFQDALRGDSTRVEWWTHVGDIRLEQRQVPEAIRAYRNALTAVGHRPDTPPRTVARVMAKLADSFARSNLITEAWSFSEQALALDGEDARALWNDLHLLPVLYEDEAWIPQVMDRYRQRLAHVEQRLRLDTPEERSAAAGGMKLPFYLHYQGGDMRPVMARYGALLHRVATAWQPDLVAPPPMPCRDGRIRIGFASYFFRGHTVSKLFGGWIRGLDRRRFSVHLYHLGPEVDETTQALQAAADTFVHLHTADAPTACRRIRDDGLHALVFPELGMASPTMQLAMFRSAPVQAMAWGHPVTTGLPTVDLFLSSEAMEPTDGQAQVTERLVRLPGLSVVVPPPRAPSERDRASFGLDDDEIVFLVPQSLFKLLPAFDEVCARILTRVPRSRIVFLEHRQGTVTALFRDRIRRTLAAHGLDAEARLRLLPPLPWADYLALNRIADVFLDAHSWSGGMTTMEALAMDLVPVTCPGGTMRARHTAAILTELGVTETIAEDVDDYVDIAVRLATDLAWRSDLQARLAAARGRLADDPRVLPALEEALVEAIDAASYQRKPTFASGMT